MKERPIPFSGELVRAILDGRKSQTRRIAKIQGYPNQDYSSWSKEAIDAVIRSRCPYGVVGDKLWVREQIDNGLQACNFYYHADNKGVGQDNYNWILARGWKLKKVIQSIFMPKTLARIWLEIKNIRVERVQEIDENGACAEGCELYTAETNLDCVRTFHRLWDTLNEKRGFGWDKNPWVWVIEFEVKK